ncbi:MAG: hypothetical protein WBQ68_12560 [Terriglobales bacterium]
MPRFTVHLGRSGILIRSVQRPDAAAAGMVSARGQVNRPGD